MQTFVVKDPETGKTVSLKGDSPPTEKELTEIFASVKAPSDTASKVMSVVRPALEAGGAAGGTIIGAGAGGFGAPVGGALGYAAGKSAADLIERGVGLKDPVPSAPAAVSETMDNVRDGMVAEIGGNVASRALSGTISKGSQVAKAVYKKAKEFGVDLTPAEATKSRALAGLEAMLAKLPWSSSVVHKFRVKQAQQLDEAATDLITTLGSPSGKEVSGTQAQKAIEDKFFKRVVTKDKLFDRLTRAVDPEKLVKTDNVRNVAEELRNAEAQLPRGDQDKEIVKYLESKIRDPHVGLSFQGLKSFRERLNARIGAIADTPEKQMFKKLKNAVDRDIAAFVETEGGKLEQAWKHANRFHGALKTLADDSNIKAVVNKANPSAIVDSIMNSENTLQLTLLRKAMPEKKFQDLQKAFVTRMFEGGVKQTPSQALAHNMKKHSPEFLEKAMGKKTLDRLQDFAKVVDDSLGAEKMVGNPSGTAQNLISILEGGFLITHPVSGATLIISQPVMAKVYLSDYGKKLITRGLKMPIDAKTAEAGGTATATMLMHLARKEMEDSK